MLMKDRKKRKPKSMFPMMGKMENRGKQFLLEDIVTLARLIFGKSISVIVALNERNDQIW